MNTETKVTVFVYSAGNLQGCQFATIVPIQNCSIIVSYIKILSIVENKQVIYERTIIKRKE